MVNFVDCVCYESIGVDYNRPFSTYSEKDKGN